MIFRNNSYFDNELCLEGHYVVTGFTNDSFCNAYGLITDLEYELHRYLRYDQKFEAVIFFHGINMLHCYDEQSFNILRGTNTDQKRSERTPESEIIKDSPLGHRRRRRRDSSEHTLLLRNDSPLNMGMQATSVALGQVAHLLNHPKHRSALVFPNINSIPKDNEIISALEELGSYYDPNRLEKQSIAIYIFRYSDYDTLRVHAGLNERFSINILSRILGENDSQRNRVINIGSPKSGEIKNLLNYLRNREELALNILPEEIAEITELLAASCARQRWGLKRLLLKIEAFIRSDPAQQLTKDNWMLCTEETEYLSPMDELMQMKGLEDVRNNKGDVTVAGVKPFFRRLYATYGNRENKGKENYSRFAPPSDLISLPSDYSLNLIIKGNPGMGKKTLTGILGRAYYQLHLLPQGHVIYCKGTDLISSNVGDSAENLSHYVREAMGGILYLEDLFPVEERQRKEIVERLLSLLSAYENQFAVVLSGKSKDIESLLKENYEINGYFQKTWEMPDYSAKEIEQIFQSRIQRDNEINAISEELNDSLHVFCDSWVSGKRRDWRNASEVVDLLEEMKRICKAKNAAEGKDTNIIELDKSDVPEKLKNCLVPLSQDIEIVKKEINEMIGLKGVKDYLFQLIENITWGSTEKEPGNYIFVGSPGTGKTMVANKMGHLLGCLGVLKRKTNNIVECKAGELLDGSRTLQEVVDDARGGVLFIDEAHQLAQNEKIGHGIIRKLVPIIEDPEVRKDTCFICAGYAAEMNDFFKVDKGLNRRFPISNRIRFDNYSAKELAMILKDMAEKKNQIVEDDYLKRSEAALEKYLEENNDPNFGNAGFIRDVFLPGSIDARTKRLNQAFLEKNGYAPIQEDIDKIDIDKRRTLTEEDIPIRFERYAGPITGFKAKRRDSKAMLEELFGKESFVSYVRSLCLLEDEDMFYDENSKSGHHISISGPIGVGKHIAIKVMAKAMKERGLLQSDTVLFRGKGDFEDQYVGHTVQKTRKIIEEAVGGVLVVENPSTMLVNDNQDRSFGPEALGAIAGAMRDYSDDLCIVFTDSPEGLNRVFKAFPVIDSALKQKFEFEDLTPMQMLSVFQKKTEKNMLFEDKVNDMLEDFFLNWVSSRGGLSENVRSWGNGNEVERLVEELKQNWKLEKGEKKDNKRWITMEMFPDRVQKYMKKESAISETAMEELKNMIGLSNVKKSIEAIERRIRNTSKDKVMPGIYCFYGNPGTGKTTVAKLMGGVLKAAKTLKQGHVIIRSAKEMATDFNEFDKILKLAENGILFIDEAHQLSESPAGRAVIKRLVTVLEDIEITKNTCIILAGYPYEMAKLLEQDSGLKSRFDTANSIIHFEDYSPEELLQILDEMAAIADKILQIGSDHPLRLSVEYREQSLKVFRMVCNSNDPNFGNARFVRNYLHDSIDELLKRLEEKYGREDDPPFDELDYLTKEDIPERYRILLDAKKTHFEPIRAERIMKSGNRITVEERDECVEKLLQSTVLLEVYKNGRKFGIGTGSIVTSDGYILTCEHVIKDADEIKARVYHPDSIGDDYLWFECETAGTVQKDYDMALLKMKAEKGNFVSMPVRPALEPISNNEEILLLGFPLGVKTADDTRKLNISPRDGRIMSNNIRNNLDHYYIDIVAYFGDSGGPVISKKDGNMIGVFNGSVPYESGSLTEEINYFYPINIFWERYTK